MLGCLFLVGDFLRIPICGVLTPNWYLEDHPRTREWGC